MEALKKRAHLDPLFLLWKNRTVDFMNAYQEQDVAGMLANCTEDCTVAFLPLGSNGAGNIHEVGKAIWSNILECFPTIDNTVHSIVMENGDVRCEASITGRQEKDFAGLVSKGNTFEEEHIFIFKMNEPGFIEAVSVNWNHDSLVKQLTEAQGTMSDEERTDLLHQIATDYVVKGLGGKNFNAIPYHEKVELRAPIHPEGSETAMVGRAFIKENWWAPLPDLVSSTELLETYINKDLSAVTVEFYCHIAEPKCTLRIVDRFEIDDNGKILRQENFFDPRDITNPGWR